MKIHPLTPHRIRLDCGQLTLEIEHYGFFTQDAVHIQFEPHQGVAVKAHYGSSVTDDHRGHIKLVRERVGAANRMEVTQ